MVAISRNLHRSYQTDDQLPFLVAEKIEFQPHRCITESILLERFSKTGSARARVHVKLRENLKIHPVRQAKLEICVANYPGTDANVICFVHGPVRDIAFDLKHAGINGEWTVGL